MPHFKIVYLCAWTHILNWISFLYIILLFISHPSSRSWIHNIQLDFDSLTTMVANFVYLHVVELDRYNICILPLFFLTLDFTYQSTSSVFSKLEVSLSTISSATYHFIFHVISLSPPPLCLSLSLWYLL